MEIWKPVVGHEGSYEVSDLGAVRSVSGPTPYKGGFRMRKGRVLRQYRGEWGHLNVKLSTGARGGVVSYWVHQLVAQAFIGSRPTGLQVRHLDGDATNNRVANLVYGTPQENSDDTLRHGTRQLGEAHHNARLTKQDVIDMRDLHTLGVSAAQLSTEFAISRPYVSDILNGRRWAHV